MSNVSDVSANAKKWSVLPSGMGGGPHGLGDPNDKRLRKVEKNVIIPDRVRARSRKEKCVQEVEAFEECAKESGLLLPFKCQKTAGVLKECLSEWFQNEELNKEVEKQYLEERTLYRTTGIGKKIKRKENVTR